MFSTFGKFTARTATRTSSGTVFPAVGLFVLGLLANLSSREEIYANPGYGFSVLALFGAAGCIGHLAASLSRRSGALDFACCAPFRARPAAVVPDGILGGWVQSGPAGFGSGRIPPGGIAANRQRGKGIQAMLSFLRDLFDPLFGLLVTTLTTFHGWGAPQWLSIVMLTVVVRTFLFPPTVRQVKCMRKLQELKPELDEIRNAHK